MPRPGSIPLVTCARIIAERIGARLLAVPSAHHLLYWFHYSPSSSGIGGAFSILGRILMAAGERVAVFLDFQNVHLVSHKLFASGSELYRCVPAPGRIADLIAGKRKRPSVATGIRVYRGRPDPERQPLVAASNDAQASEWTRDRRVTMVRRQLNYRGWPRLPGQERASTSRSP
jgi:hypothetical protein